MVTRSVGQEVIGKFPGHEFGGVVSHFYGACASYVLVMNIKYKSNLVNRKELSQIQLHEQPV
jgi:hypothetical protein